MPDNREALPPLTRRSIFDQAWPIILGQATVPLVGLVDVTVIGRTGSAAALAGVALGSTIITFLFWAFGFLRMGVTGLTAQALGAGNRPEMAATLFRALLLGLAAGLLLLALSPQLIPFSLRLMAAPDLAAGDARLYTTARFFGAPAALGFYALNGWLLGLGRTRLSLLCQLALNGANIFLDILLTGLLGMGALGIGIGTAVAEWSALLVALFLARRILGPGWRLYAHPALLFSWPEFRHLLRVNRDIMIRTLSLLFLLSWFARSGAQQGTVPLAANHLLMQFVGVTSFVLDGFAFTAEARVGAAVGARSHAAVRHAIRLTGEFSFVFALLFSAVLLLAGGLFIDAITTDPSVRRAARAMLPFCAAIPLLGMPGWLLDGVFIGATRGKVLRNTALLSTIAYLATDHLLSGQGNAGVWAALLASYVYRGLTLGVALPALFRNLRRSRSFPL